MFHQVKALLLKWYGLSYLTVSSVNYPWFKRAIKLTESTAVPTTYPCFYVYNNQLCYRTSASAVTVLGDLSTLTGKTTLVQKANGVLTGSIDPAASTTVTGVGTKFLTEVRVGDSILVSGETRGVVSIASDTSLTVDAAFSNNANDTSPEVVYAPLMIFESDGTTVAGYITPTGGIVATGNSVIVGSLQLGIPGTVQGSVVLGAAAANAPGYVCLYSTNGTPLYIFAADNGTLRKHTAIPTANTDGTAVDNPA